MSDEARLGPEHLTTKGISTGRRGYEKREVDRLLKGAARAWRSLQAEHERFVAEIDRVGGLEFLARDLGSIGTDVTRLLSDAQQAAEGLRTRAREDSEQRLAAAAAAAQSLVGEAQEQSFEVRRDAWGTGTELLDQVRTTIEAMIE